MLRLLGEGASGISNWVDDMAGLHAALTVQVRDRYRPMDQLSMSVWLLLLLLLRLLLLTVHEGLRPQLHLKHLLMCGCSAKCQSQSPLSFTSHLLECARGFLLALPDDS